MSRNDSLEQIERSIGRIGVVGSSVRAVRWRAAHAGVEVSAPGMGILGVLERDGPQRVSLVARRAGMVGPQASRELRALEVAGYVERTADGTDRRAVVVSINAEGHRCLPEAPRCLGGGRGPGVGGMVFRRADQAGPTPPPHGRRLHGGCP